MEKVEPADTVELAVSPALSLEAESVALKRLIEEVRTGEPVMSGNYNRTHNRHNR
ncbi:YhhA family cyclophane-containing RiPP [Streptomyces sp. NPDC008079]|uniref:YhhA family cyclophane-containing RiPP n=1 Tax=Streptomyces sp. NPDC008079 TaxID=3364806 RepID=UPI0036EA8B32